MSGILVNIMKLKTTKKPYLALASISCLLLSPVFSLVASVMFAPKEDYTGYGALGIALLGLVIFLFMALTLGVVSLILSEKPKWVSILTTSLCALAILWVLLKKPF